MTSTIPFKILSLDSEGYHLMIKVKINGKAANLILDTGASKTVLDKTRVAKFVKESDFKTHDKLSSGLGTNTMESQTTVLKKLKIGEVEITDYTTVLLDLSHVNASYEQIGLKQVEGVLGSDILMQYKAVIDYEKKVLKLKFTKVKKK
ncbi:MAG: putative aspartyl protease [Bacteroidetes bacterium]|nr:putative aspartyl protease [Bacteroidota bacterium]